MTEMSTDGREERKHTHNKEDANLFSKATTSATTSIEFLIYSYFLQHTKPLQQKGEQKTT